jgi:D-xylose transport system substrate-binding protein
MTELRSPRLLIMVASLVVSVAIGVVLSRSGRQGAPNGTQKLVLGLSLDTLKEARWQRDRDEFVARARALGAEVLVQSANSDDARQLADVEALVSRGVSALVIVPHDGLAMAKAVAVAHKAGIPVLSYDRLIRDADVDLYVSFDNLRVGELQAKYLVGHLPPGPKRIVRIYGARSDNNASLFKEGQDRIILPLARSGMVTVVHEDWAEDWKPEAAKKIVNAAITRNPDGIHGVLASNDGTASGAIQALLEEGLGGKVVVTGQDADLVACQNIARGMQHMTIYKPIRELATRAAEAAVRLGRRQVVVAKDSVNNGRVDVPSVLVDVVTVTKENLRETVVRDGYHEHGAVFGGAP